MHCSQASVAAVGALWVGSREGIEGGRANQVSAPGRRAGLSTNSQWNGRVAVGPPSNWEPFVVQASGFYLLLASCPCQIRCYVVVFSCGSARRLWGVGRPPGKPAPTQRCRRACSDGLGPRSRSRRDQFFDSSALLAGGSWRTLAFTVRGR